MANPNRIAGKQIASETRTPSQIVSSGFSVPTPTNDNSPKSSRNNIVGLSPSTPREIEDRRKSLEKASDVSGLDPKLKDGVNQTYAGGALDLMNNPTRIRNKNGTLLTEPQKEYSDEEVEELFRDEQFQPDFEIRSGGTVDDTRSKRFFRVKKALHASGYNMSNAEVLSLLSSNFKVKFPWAPIITNVSRGVAEVTGWIIGIFIGIGGMAVSISLKFIPFIGWFASFLGAKAVAAVGIGISLITYFTSMLIAGISIWLSHKYLQNGSDPIRKIPIMRKLMYRYFIKTVWGKLIGAVTPLAGWIVNIVVIIIDWMYLKKVTRKIQKIVNN